MINRTTDRQVYQPRIHADQIHALYLEGQRQGRPMTDLIADAITQYLQEGRIWRQSYTSTGASVGDSRTPTA